jgi:hypothetical protein
MFAFFILTLFRSNLQLDLSDLWGVDPPLARSFQLLLDYDSDATLYTDIDASFIASANPLLSSGTSHNTMEPCCFVDLIPNGKQTPVTKANRAEFVNLYVQHALFGSCLTAVSDFISGVTSVISGPGVNMCSDIEASLLPSITAILVSNISCSLKHCSVERQI